MRVGSEECGQDEEKLWRKSEGLLWIETMVKRGGLGEGIQGSEVLRKIV